METVSLGRGVGSALCVVKIVSPGTVWIISAAQRSEAKGLKAIPGSLVKANWTDSLRAFSFVCMFKPRGWDVTPQKHHATQEGGVEAHRGQRCGRNSKSCVAECKETVAIASLWSALGAQTNTSVYMFVTGPWQPTKHANQTQAAQCNAMQC